MYFDDAVFVNLQAARRAGQAAANALTARCGTQLAPHKRQQMSTYGDFLGISCDTSKAAQGVVLFEPRQQMRKNIMDAAVEAVHSDYLTPAQAA